MSDCLFLKHSHPIKMQRHSYHFQYVILVHKLNVMTSNGNPHIFVDMVPLLNEEYLNVVKVVSISMGIGVAKAILISLTAISSSCDFLVCTFVFFKSTQLNASTFRMAFCGFQKCNQIDAD